MNTRIVFFLCLLLPCTLLPGNVLAKDLLFSSSESRVSLLELYTSEGCSSCPPAERWMSQLQDSNVLWKSVVPVAFHVDYWDYLGWKDQYAHPSFAERQYRYQQLNHVSAVYTPGMMKNGREWRGWRRGDKPQAEVDDKPGHISATLREKLLSVTFHYTRKTQSPYILNVALLGSDLRQLIRAGENSGKLLTHNFVVLDLQQHPVHSARNNAVEWAIDKPLDSINDNFDAIAIWVTTKLDPTPIQAAGRWVPDNNFEKIIPRKSSRF